jgi:hypothetical protein
MWSDLAMASSTARHGESDSEGKLHQYVFHISFDIFQFVIFLASLSRATT